MDSLSDLQPDKVCGFEACHERPLLTWLSRPTQPMGSDYKPGAFFTMREVVVVERSKWYDSNSRVLHSTRKSLSMSLIISYSCHIIQFQHITGKIQFSPVPT